LSSKSTFSSATSASYAVALYELAQENSDLDKVEENMKSIKQLLNTSIEFKETILNPTIAKEHKATVISLISKNYDFAKTLKKFLDFVVVKNRLFFIEKIVESFLNLVSKNKGELKAKFISAKKLSEEEEQKIQNELSKDFKSKLSISYSYDPSLIAGLIIQVGSIMVDTSVKTKLKQLEQKMIEV
jgi:F-type H+-transporting ATPase subunit delta